MTDVVQVIDVVQFISVDLCRPSPTARPVQPIRVEILARSIAEVGLRQPINVRPVEGGYEIRGGGHRHAAFVSLGRKDIPAFVRTDDDLHAELAEIDENLIRNELSPAERAISIARRKAIYEELHPETKHGTPGVSRQVGDTRERGDKTRFTKQTADTTGESERSIQRNAKRGEELGTEALRRVVNTSLDKGEELDALAKLTPEHRDRLIDRAAAGEEVSAKAGDGALPNGARSIMGSRNEPDDSLDYFPTPPWATRALIEHVLPQAGRRADIARQLAWEPACGEGHMAEVLAEYFGEVVASDIHDYGYSPQHVVDFLKCDQITRPRDADFIISNPPFGDVTEAFVLKALSLAKVGVAMFVRLQWLETIGRYETIFKDNPPTIIAFFAERVNLCKGRWEPDGSTATAYIWLVWIKGAAPRAPFWIPPKRREELTRPDDAHRFTAHPVVHVDHVPDAGNMVPESAAFKRGLNSRRLAREILRKVAREGLVDAVMDFAAASA